MNEWRVGIFVTYAIMTNPDDAYLLHNPTYPGSDIRSSMAAAHLTHSGWVSGKRQILSIQSIEKDEAY